MGYFQVRYDSRVIIYDRKMFIRLDTGHSAVGNQPLCQLCHNNCPVRILPKQFVLERYHHILCDISVPKKAIFVKRAAA